MPKEDSGARGPIAREPDPICPAAGPERENLDIRPEGMDSELAIEAGSAPDAADGVLGDGFGSPSPMAGEANRRKLKQTYRARRCATLDERLERARQDSSAREAERNQPVVGRRVER